MSALYGDLRLLDYSFPFLDVALDGIAKLLGWTSERFDAFVRHTLLHILVLQHPSYAFIPDGYDIARQTFRTEHAPPDHDLVTFDRFADRGYTRQGGHGLLARNTDTSQPVRSNVGNSRW